MNFAEANHYLLSLNNLPRGRRDPKNKSNLNRLRFLFKLIGHPENKILNYIHVTGTSGKGSLCLMLSGILTAAGKKTGLLVSPHISRINERWQINGRPMPPKTFVRIVTVFKNALDRYAQSAKFDYPSFFDMTTAIGLYYFALEKVDWAVVEAGIGGLTDSTNVIPAPRVAVITHVDLDHQHLIGPSREDIAGEKSGIIKKNSQVFTLEKRKNILEIFRRAAKKAGASFYPLRPIFTTERMHTKQTAFTYHKKTYRLPAAGLHQITNAIMAIEIAESLKLPPSAILQGLWQTKFPLRVEIMRRRPLIILDGAHNPDKMNATVKTVAEFKKNIPTQDLPAGKAGRDPRLVAGKIKNVHLLLGFSQDKDIANMLRPLSSLRPKSIALTRFTSNLFRRTADPRLLAKKLRHLAPRAKIMVFLDPQIALNWSLKQTKKNDLLLITGSIFLSGELRPRLR